MLERYGRTPHDRAEAVPKEPRDEAPAMEATPDDPAVLGDGAVAELATSLWRLRTRAERSPDTPRVMVRHLEAAWDVLAEAGIEIKDHVNEPFDPGVAFKVLAFQPTPGIVREQVVETMRPGIYLGSRTLQMAEVIVGTPEREIAPEDETREVDG